MLPPVDGLNPLVTIPANFNNSKNAEHKTDALASNISKQSSDSSEKLNERKTICKNLSRLRSFSIKKEKEDFTQKKLLIPGDSALKIDVIQEEGALRKIKELLKSTRPLTPDQIRESILFFVIPAYSVLHSICQKQYTEENIEYLFDYVSLTQIDQQRKISPLEGVDVFIKTCIIKKYLNDGAEKSITIDCNLRHAAIKAYNNKDFNQIGALLEEITSSVTTLLWQNTLGKVLRNPDSLKLILESFNPPS